MGSVGNSELTDQDRFAGIPDQHLQDIHMICETFEKSLGTEAEASIEESLATSADEIRDTLFRELLAIELERCMPCDEHSVSSYLIRFPDRAVDVEQVWREMSVNLAEQKNDTVQRLSHDFIEDRNPEHRYRLDGEIARGGMGMIIKGRDNELGRDLAIKVLLDSHRDNTAIVRRFVDEARICGQLQHPGIAPVYEMGHFADQRPYFTMKLVQGETLSKLIAERDDSAVGRGKMIGIFAQICETMAYAHSRGVIHRDLKPANVMVGAFGQVQVMDWGLAKVFTAAGLTDEKGAVVQPHASTTTAMTQDSTRPDVAIARGTQTQWGSVMGTPAYMPPEQALGDVESLDERADVFSLGAILCEILTGKPPYATDNGTNPYDLARQGQLDECIERLADCGADPVLISLTVQCLQLKTHDRPRDASALASLVTQYLESVESRLRTAELERTAQAARADAQAALAEAEGRRAESESRRAVAEAQRLELEQRSARKLQKMLALTAAVALIAAIAFVAVIVANKQLIQVAEVARREESSARYFAKQAAAQAIEAQQNAALAEVESRSARTAEQAARKLANAETAAKLLAEQERRRAEVATERAEEEVKRSEWLVYVTKLMLAKADFENGNGMLARHYLNASQPNLRGWEYRYLATRIINKRTLRGHSNAVTSAAFRFDGKAIATGSMDGTAKLWDAATGRVLVAFPASAGPVKSVAISPDGSHIVTASERDTATVWDAQTGQVVLTINHRIDLVKTMAISPDGESVAIGGGVAYQPSDVTLWNVKTGKRQIILKGHQDHVASLAFSADGKQILTASVNDARVWDLSASREVLRVRHGDILGSIWSVAFSPDGRLIATGGEDGKAKLWDAESGHEVHLLKGHRSGVASLAFSPDGGRIATGSWDRTLKIWDVEQGDETLALKGHTDRVLSVAFSADGKQLMSGSSDHTAKVWDAQRGQEIIAVQHGPVGAVWSITFSPDSRRIVTGSDVWSDHTVRIWDVETGRGVAACKGHEADVLSVTMSPDGQRLLTASLDNTVRLWDATTGRQLRVIAGHTFPVSYSPDGATFVTGCNDNSLRLLNSDTMQEVVSLRGHSGMIKSVAFSPDGQRLVSGGDDSTAKVWNVETGDNLFDLQGHHGRVTGVAFSPNGKDIVTAGEDMTARVWNADTGRQLQVLRGHTAALRAVAYSPDGQRVITASDDRSTRIWEPQRGLEVLSLNGHSTEVLCLAVSPDGKRIATGTANPDNMTRLWYAASDPEKDLWPLPETQVSKSRTTTP